MVELSRVPGSAAAAPDGGVITPRLPGPSALLRQRRAVRPVHATNITLDFAVLPAYAFARQRRVPFVCTGPTILRYYSMRHQVELLRRSDRVIN